MSRSGIQFAQVILVLLLLFVVAFAALARKLKTPYPIVLVIAGSLLGFFPGIPRINLDPELVFFVVLPPLLYSGAWTISWKSFSHNLLPISSLAIGLVAFTVAGVALIGPMVFRGFDWRIGFALGAVVATTDAIAATSIANRLGLPRRVVTLLEGESLVNDATGLLALEFATALVVYGSTPTIGSGLGRMVVLTVGGIVVGLLIGRITEWFEHLIDDGPIEIAISILVPYAAYVIGEALHVSGVIAVVAAGLYLSDKSSAFFSPNVRIQAWAVWDSLTFIINGLVFILVGLQLPSVLAGIRGLSVRELVLYGASLSVLVILLRLLWAFPSTWLTYFVRNRVLKHRSEPPSRRELFVVGWTGMRGVIALSAAVSLPDTTASGAPFPYRNLIVFLTFCVIFVTLVVQGLTLPYLIKALGLSHVTDSTYGEREARRVLATSALDRIEQLRASERDGANDAYDHLAQHYEARLASMGSTGEVRSAAGGAFYLRYLELSRSLLEVERASALRLRDEGTISEEVLRQLVYELDLEETRLGEVLRRARRPRSLTSATQ